jgi:hypothetical protein
MTDIAEATLVMSTVVKNVSGMNQLSPFLLKPAVACLLPGLDFLHLMTNAVILIWLLHFCLSTGWTCTWWLQL